MKSQAIVAYGKPLEEVTSDIPAPKGTEVVVKITHSGVCHSDVHLQDGGGAGTHVVAELPGRVQRLAHGDGHLSELHPVRRAADRAGVWL